MCSFLCSDGILEELYDEDLCAMLTNTNYSDEQRMQVLMQFCEENKDNHTAWFVRVVSCGDDVYQPQAQPEHSKKHIQQSIDVIKAAMQPRVEMRLQSVDAFLAMLPTLETSERGASRKQKQTFLQRLCNIFK